MGKTVSCIEREVILEKRFVIQKHTTYTMFYRMGLLNVLAHDLIRDEIVSDNRFGMETLMATPYIRN